MLLLASPIIRFSNKKSAPSFMSNVSFRMKSTN
jgi:hypothetical protein